MTTECRWSPVSVELSGGAESSTNYLVTTIYVLALFENCVWSGTYDNSACSLAGAEDAEDSCVESVDVSGRLWYCLCVDEHVGFCKYWRFLTNLA